MASYNICVSFEGRRGCGYRKPGGLYLVADGVGRPCGKLPLVLDVCPCCGAGIKPARGWTWIDADKIFDGVECDVRGQGEYAICNCPLAGRIGRAGLIWVGEKHYPTPGKWLREAENMGISRRIPAIPRDFVLGETFVCCAHRKALERFDDDKGEVITEAAIFHVWKPQRIEYIITGEESDDVLEGLENRGVTLVKVSIKDKQEGVFDYDDE